MSLSADQIAENVAHVGERIARAAERGRRDSREVLVVAVTKTHGPDLIRAAYQAGLRHFGENRVEEAQEKLPVVLPNVPGSVWHMIGHIQSRKTADVAATFGWTHSIDRLKIARRLSEARAAVGEPLPILLEVNLSGEESKTGFDLSRWPDDPAQAEPFFAEVEPMLGLPGVRVKGLMTMAPYTDEPETARPIFRRLRLLREALCDHFPDQDWTHLSMGMSGDFEVAVEEGATMVRLGTILFGPRNYGRSNAMDD